MSAVDINALLALGAEKANQNDWSAAGQAFNCVLAVDATQPVALAGLGGVLYLTQRYQEAEHLLKVALQQTKVLPQSYFYWAKLCIKKEKWEEAVEAIFHSIQLSSEVAEQYLVLAQAYEKQSKWGCAAGAYCYLLQQYPERSDIWGKLAWCWKKQGLMDAALDVYGNMGALLAKEKSSGFYIEEILEKGERLLSKDEQEKVKLRISQVNDGSDQGNRWNMAAEAISEGKTRIGLQFLANEAKRNKDNILPEVPWWEGLYFSKQRLLIYDEESYIDAAAFFRYISCAKKRGGIVILAVREKWLALAETLTDIDYIIPLGEMKKLKHIHWKISVLALPEVFGITRKTINFAQYEVKKNYSELLRREKPQIGVLCSKELNMCLEKVKLIFPQFEWMNLSAQEQKQIFDNSSILELFISDNREVCHWLGLKGIPFLYLARCMEYETWWEEGAWYEESGVIRQMVPGDWFLAELEMTNFLKNWEKKNDS